MPSTGLTQPVPTPETSGLGGLMTQATLGGCTERNGPPISPYCRWSRPRQRGGGGGEGRGDLCVHLDVSRVNKEQMTRGGKGRKERFTLGKRGES